MEAIHVDKVLKNGQILNIKPKNLERYARPEDKFDSTLEERERTYQTRKPTPRLTEYR
jgi:hypothetical protein